MGFYGEVICYTTRAHTDPIGLLSGVMEALELKEVHRVMRWIDPDNTWKYWQLETSGVQPPDEAGHESFGGGCDVKELTELYPEEGRLLVACDVSTLARAVSEACGRIPEGITNRFAPSASPSICVGWHDIIDGEYEAEPFLLDRAFLSVTLSNPGAPNDWKETRERILALPELKTYRETLEEVVGPMKTWVMWT